MVENCLPFLEREIDILKPTLVVAVGRKAKRVLEKHFANKGLRMESIIHYACRRKNTKEKLENDLQKIKRLLRRQER